ncbi:MAG: hypothetical protein EDS66_13720 [Planctomycetota bacterium]|nr:MAG: hypothetical protein EDS66_13720 [Planctomycetota bacterium]
MASERVRHLATALAAGKAAAEAIPVEDLRGSGNLDYPNVRLLGWRRTDVEAAARIAQVHPSKGTAGWWGFGGWEHWQGENRTAKAHAFAQAMQDHGYQAGVAYVMD